MTTVIVKSGIAFQLNALIGSPVENSINLFEVVNPSHTGHAMLYLKEGKTKLVTFLHFPDSLFLRHVNSIDDSIALCSPVTWAVIFWSWIILS